MIYILLFIKIQFIFINRAIIIDYIIYIQKNIGKN